MNQNKNQSQNSYSITMDLENLRKQYSNLLIKYQAAVEEYNTYLTEQHKYPCKKYSMRSTGIDDDCINYVWKKAGCGTGSLNIANDKKLKNRSLGDIIFISWMLSKNEIEKCYGKSTNYNTSTEPDFNINSQQFATVQGMEFPGTGEARSWMTQKQSETMQDCIALCNSSPMCTGANFVSNKCSIRTGDSPLVTSSPDSYAIVPKEKMLLLNMEDINKQMLDINEKIENIIKTTTHVYKKTNKESKLKNKELIDNYDKLLNERRSIVEKLNEYETLAAVDNETQIITSNNYNAYILSSILVIAVITLFYKIVDSKTTQSAPIIQQGGALGKSAYYITFGLVLFVIVLSRTINY
jgi:hypothetical protein